MSVDIWWRKKRKYFRLCRTYLRNRFGSTALFVRIIPTDKCNLNCSYCWQRDDNPVEMTEDTFYAHLRKARDLGAGVVSFLGGEPMAWEPIYRAIAACSKEGILSDLTTNGTLLTGENIDRLGKAGLDYLNISVDVLQSTEVSAKNAIFREGVLENLVAAKAAYKTRFRVNTVLYRENIDAVKELIEFTGQRRVPISIGYIVPPHDEGAIQNPELYFTPDDEEQLRDIIAFIADRKKHGYRIIDPQEYFDNIFRYLKRESFWHCNYPKRFGWINVAPSGRLRTCTKKMDEAEFTFLELDGNKLREYRKMLAQSVTECNPSCYSNCAYVGYYYLNNKRKIFQKVLVGW